MKVLIVLTSHDKLGNTGQKTGFWLEELASPYYVFKDNKAEITLASPLGGQPPLDPKSDEPDYQTQATKRFQNDDTAQAQLSNTVILSSINADDYDAVFYPGGHGPLWDLAEDKNSIALIENMHGANKLVGLVCHAPAALIHTKGTDGKPLVNNKRVTGFTNGEEAGVELTEIVPFLVEDMLINNGGLYQKAEDWHVHIEADGNLITGQNPASSEAVAEKMLSILTA